MTTKYSRSRREALAGVASVAALSAIGTRHVFAADREPVTVSLLSAPFGSGSYVLGSTLEEISKKHHPWLRISHAESPGFVFNIKKLDREPELKKSLIVGSGAGVSSLAAAGEKPFDKKYPPLLLLGTYNLTANWLATLDPNIKSIKDLAGKKVALGRSTQINWTIQPEWLIRYGWEMADKIKVQHIGTKGAVDALLDGTVDAAVVGGYFDPLTGKLELSPQTVELMAAGRSVHHISWGADAVRKTIERQMKIMPLTIPAGAMQGLSGPLDAVADTVAWMVAPEFPEDLAYETTKLIIGNLGTFAEVHALGKLMSPQALVYGANPQDIHPGALRAYREAGIMK